MTAAPEARRFTPSLLAGLDEPVRRYLSHAGRDGAELGAGVQHDDDGTHQGRPVAAVPRAHQECDGRSFAWRARVGVGPLAARSRFAEGVGWTAASSGA